MNNKKVLFVGIVFIGIICLIANLRIFYFKTSAEKQCETDSLCYKNEDIIVPNCNTITGVYVYLTRDDYETLFDEKVLFNRVLYTTEKDVICKFTNEFEYSSTGGDLCTCTSLICFVKNDSIIEKSDCCITSQGLWLQNEKYGLLEPANSNTLYLLKKCFNNNVGYIYIR